MTSKGKKSKKKEILKMLQDKVDSTINKIKEKSKSKGKCKKLAEN